jgi:glutamate/tyrosine decarboxylase-like PLP-dependent enzyme
VVARAEARKKYPDIKKWVIACSKEAHSSIKSAAEVMDVGVLTINTDENYKITKKNASRAIIKYHEDNKDSRVFAIIATAGTTNLGVIDDLKGIGELSKRLDIWYHIDGAYGLAALASPKSKELFKGVELADSFIVDPHKWLFAPFDACALIYREPELARETHTQHAGYLKILDNDEWNPSDYAIQLTRRVRGLPFWFSLAVHGTDKYAESIDKTMLLAKESARLIKDNPNLELIMEPELSIVAFKKIGWREEDYQRWSDKLLNDQLAFVTPSDHDNETILRFAIVNPWTNITDIKIILATL